VNAQQIVDELRALGTEPYRKILRNHGATEPLFGVKIEELKKFQKRIKKDYTLAKELYETGIYDAMYLAGLIADDARMTPSDLDHWAASSGCQGIAEYTVAWVAAESPHGWERANAWIESPDERIASSGWATLAGLVSLEADADLDLAALEKLLDRVRDTIHTQPNRVRYTMNSFVIGVGCYVLALTDRALTTAAALGTVTVDMGGTACKVPAAADYVEKVRQRGSLGKKKKTVKC
jgi:3-methyladenine DNA glycosylase AlkD